jgi:hypothetical protein
VRSGDERLLVFQMLRFAKDRFRVGAHPRERALRYPREADELADHFAFQTRALLGKPR